MNTDQDRAGWQVHALSDVAKIVTGSTPPKANAHFYGGPIPLVKPGELRGSLVSEAQDSLTEEGGAVADVAPEGSILVSCIGNLGKVGLAAKPVAFNQQINAVIPNSRKSSRWIFYALQAPSFIAQLNAVSSATTIAIVNKGKFSKLTISWAPDDEQRRIVAELETQLTRLDASVTALKRVQANLKRYRASVLKAACEGRLVPTEAELARRERRSYESGSDFVERVVRNRRAVWESQPVNARRKKYQEPLAPSGSPTGLPEGWAWGTLDQLSLLDVGFAFKSAEFANEGIRLLRGENMEPGAFRWAETRHWPESKLQGFEHLLIQEGQIVLAMDRPLISAGLKIARARASDLPCLLVQRMARFRPVFIEMTTFLYQAMQSEAFIKHLLGGQTGTQLPHISGEGIQGFHVPVPPLAEQHRIVAEVERRLSVIEELETTVAANLKRAERLRQAVLSKAFAG